MVASSSLLHEHTHARMHALMHEYKCSTMLNRQCIVLEASGVVECPGV
jgi:hypothetical protein